MHAISQSGPVPSCSRLNPNPGASSPGSGVLFPLLPVFSDPGLASLLGYGADSIVGSRFWMSDPQAGIANLNARLDTAYAYVPIEAYGMWVVLYVCYHVCMACVYCRQFHWVVSVRAIA